MSAIEMDSSFISGFIITNAIVVIKVLTRPIFAIFFCSSDSFIKVCLGC